MAKEPQELLLKLDQQALIDLWYDPSLGLSEVFGSRKRHDAEILFETMVGYFDEQLLAQRPIRNALLYAHKTPTNKLLEEFNETRTASNGNKLTRSFDDWEDQLYKKWVAGGPWARSFCRAFRLDPKYAGYKAEPRPQSLEVLEAYEPLEPLLEFQEDLSNRIFKRICRKPAGRSMATLPTGAGKTRTMIDAILRFQAERPGVVLWIATTSEVCEQAAKAYKRSYENCAPSFGSAVQRFWGDSYKLRGNFSQGLLVAGIQKLYSQIEESEVLREMIKKHVTLVVFDEAHHATAPTYKQTLNTICELRKRPRVPLIGLTATPGKGTDADGEGVRKLAKFFDCDLLQSKQLKNKKLPIQWLQGQKVLSKVDKLNVAGEKNIKLTAEEKKHMLKFSSFSPELLERVGKIPGRNTKILRHGSDTQKTLVFACDTLQAHLLAHEWRKRYDNKNIARSITAETPYALRRRWLQEFMDTESELKIIVNVGVLTTGFDAPKVERLILARPTMSRVLFEQMVGRGLRGPLFGGYESCKVIDIVDSFTNFGGIKAAAAFEHAWLKGKHL
tara:strand:- start:2834 stop:4510 length:1677 start_codon:yes stop_codon:yes gene_type:complete